MLYGHGVVSFTRIDAPRSKSPPTSNGTFARRCILLKKTAIAYGFAL